MSKAPKIGIISKLILSEYGEILQALDINFIKALEILGFKSEVLAYFNSTLQGLDALIISGGNDLNSVSQSKINALRDRFEFSCIKKALELNIPILGICKGAQSLACELNAQILPCKNHIGEHEIIWQDGKILKVNSYHNYSINAPINADILAMANDESIEAFINKDKKILGAMWHFEREQDLNNLSEASKRIFDIFKGLI